MFEEQLATYGALGLWTATLLYQQVVKQKHTDLLIENNTKALILVYELMSGCARKQNIYKE